MGTLLNRRRYMGGVARQPRLPAEYQEVKYIQNVDGTAALETGYKFNFNNYEFECTFSKDAVPAVNQESVFGTRFSNNQQFNFRYDIRPAKQMQFAISNKENIKLSDSYGVVHTAKYIGGSSSQEVWFDGSQLRSYTYTDLPSTTTFQLRLYKNADTDQTFKGKIWYAKLRSISAATTLLEYIPCYRKVDSYPGFYDLATDTFKTITDADLHWECGPNV
jgi:hypothetical protein